MEGDSLVGGAESVGPTYCRGGAALRAGAAGAGLRDTVVGALTGA
jgi:hypothetical protein